MATKVKTRPKGRSSGDKIYQRALETVFPMPEDVDPAEVEGLLIGIATSLEAVGFELTPQEEDA